MNRVLEILKEKEKLNRFIAENKAQMKKIGIIVILVVVGLVFFAVNGTGDGAEIIEEDKETIVEEEAGTTIFVDIGGAVNTPMLAELPAGSRVEDAIVAAGGLTDEADLTSINRAEFLEDGVKIYIPSGTVEEAPLGEGVSVSEDTPGTAASVGNQGKVNINIADLEALQTLNGVGPATAQKIIDYRKANGRFKRIEDLKQVSGIGDKTFEKLKYYISI